MHPIDTGNSTAFVYLHSYLLRQLNLNGVVNTGCTDEGMLSDFFNHPHNYFSGLTFLGLSRCRFLSPQAIESILSVCHNTLTHLDLSFCVGAVTDDLCHSILPLSLPNLTSVSFSGCMHLSSTGLVPLISNTTTIRHLYLASCYDIRDEVVTAVASHCKNLETLGILQ